MVYAWSLQPAGQLVFCSVLFTMLALRPAPAEAHEQRQQERRFLEGDWVVVGGVEPEVESNLLRPLLLNADQRQLYVFDYGDYAVKAFDWNGLMTWAVGNRGKGPNEFTNPTDLKLDTDGNVWVLDPPNRRVTVVEASGRVSRLVPLRGEVGGSIHGVLPSAGDNFWVLVLGHDVLAVKFDKDGNVIDDQPLPDQLTSVPTVARQPVVAWAGSDRVFIGFLWSSALARWSVEQKRLEFFPGVESVEFPPIRERKVLGGGVFRGVDPSTATLATRGLGIFGDTAYVLFAGASRFKGRLIDMYSTQSGTYLGSHLLPEKIRALVVVEDGHFVGLIATPVPAIRIWQWHAK